MNEVILLGQGTLKHKIDDVRPIDLLHAGAHLAYPVLEGIEFAAYHEHEPPNIDDYLSKYLDVYIERINAIAILFVDGEGRDIAKKKAIDLHRLV